MNFVTAVSSYFTLCPFHQRKYSRFCFALRKGAIAQALFVALVFSIIVNTIVLQSSSQFSAGIHVLHQVLQAALASQDLLLKSHFSTPQFDLFYLGGIRCNCSWFSTPQLCGSRRRRGGTGVVCTCICLVSSNTGVGNLHVHPLTIELVDTQLISWCCDTVDKKDTAGRRRRTRRSADASTSQRRATPSIGSGAG